MILVDSSVLVDHFNGTETAETERMRSAVEGGGVIVGDLMVLEVLQGFHSDRAFAEARRLLGLFPVIPLLGPENAVQGARHYRRLRQVGITIRKTNDVIIATWCIQARVPLLYSDRDFDPFVEHLGLKAA
ncbi:MAG: PIN domain nuclease [Rhodothermales bacterium]|nr:PIN domain nuclease [Rhodothermales bacterium]MBO6781095.1 PIN domain nuclease [Rhodothermales bacterium]